MSAQGLKVSNAALLYLIDHLECKKIRIDISSARRQGIEKIQNQIKAELLARLDLSATLERGDSAANSEHAVVDRAQPLPFIISQRYFS